MRSIPDATAIALTEEERAELKGLARSLKGEHRMRLRARIVLLASDGAPMRQIARTVGCTIGTASKWRGRYADKRMAGLDGTGDRGAEPKYGPEHNARILALLDQKPPAGYANQTLGSVAAAR
jgi:transposase